MKSKDEISSHFLKFEDETEVKGKKTNIPWFEVLSSFCYGREISEKIEKKRYRRQPPPFVLWWTWILFFLGAHPASSPKIFDHHTRIPNIIVTVRQKEFKRNYERPGLVAPRALGLKVLNGNLLEVLCRSFERIIGHQILWQKSFV